MNENEYKKFKENQKNMPIKSQIFKNKITGEYKTQLNIFELGDYEKVES